MLNVKSSASSALTKSSGCSDQYFGRFQFPWYRPSLCYGSVIVSDRSFLIVSFLSSSKVLGACVDRLCRTNSSIHPIQCNLHLYICTNSGLKCFTFQTTKKNLPQTRPIFVSCYKCSLRPYEIWFEEHHSLALPSKCHVSVASACWSFMPVHALYWSKR